MKYSTNPPYWVTRDGVKILLYDMETIHLRRTRDYIKRVTLKYGGVSSIGTNLPMWLRLFEDELKVRSDEPYGNSKNKTIEEIKAERVLKRTILGLSPPMEGESVHKKLKPKRSLFNGQTFNKRPQKKA